MQFEMDTILAFPALTVGANQVITPTGTGSLTITANTLKVGSRIKIQAVLSFTNGAGTGFLNSLECKLGGGGFIAAFASVAGDSSNQAVVEWDFLVTGATEYHYMGRSMFNSGSSLTSTQKSLATTPSTYASFDITANQAVSFQYSINTDTISAASLLRCEILIINPA
jgi:hypothetical protein